MKTSLSSTLGTICKEINHKLENDHQPFSLIQTENKSKFYFNGTSNLNDEKIKDLFTRYISSMGIELLLVEGSPLQDRLLTLKIIDKALILSSDNTESVPKKFRKIEYPNYDLSVSASAQPSGSQFHKLKEMAKSAGKQLWVIDLRQESHFFAEDTAITYYKQKENDANKDLSPEEITELEKKLQSSLKEQKSVIVYDRPTAENNHNFRYTVDRHLNTEQLQTEEELLKHLDIIYHRIYCTDHDTEQMTTQAANIFKLIQKAQKQKNVWIHFHCHGGNTRSSTAILSTHLFIHKDDDLSCNELIDSALKKNPSLKTEKKKRSKIQKQLEKIFAMAENFKHT